MHAATAAINSPDLRDTITDDFPDTTLKTRLTQHDLRGLSPLFGGLSPWNPVFVRHEPRALSVL
jgi:hypothetical protein